MRHKWENGKCAQCGIERKVMYQRDKKSKSPHKRNGKYYGRTKMAWLVGGEWVFTLPECRAEKKCNRCGKKKEESEYGMHTGTNKKTGKKYRFRKGTCKKCECELQQIYYAAHKDNEEFKKKNQARARAYAAKHREKISKRQRTVRGSGGYKEYMRQWYKDHMDQTRILGRARNKKYHKKIIGAISDQYILQLLMHPREVVKHGMTREEMKARQDLIDAKKASVAICRIRRLIKKIDKNKSQKP